MAAQFSLFQIGLIQSTLTALTVFHAFYTKKQFFPACVFLLQSKPSLLILVSFGAYLMLAAANVLRFLVFGELRLIEFEHLHERGWMALSELLLAMTIFRNDFDTSVIFLFTGLLICKAFHWITRDRVDYMEQAIRLPDKFHARILTALYMLAITDVAMAFISVSNVVKNGASLSILIANEVLSLISTRLSNRIFKFILMLLSTISSLSRYILNMNDIRLGTQWEKRSTCLFYLDFIFGTRHRRAYMLAWLITFLDFTRLLVYLIFFSAIITFYGIPIHIIRELYLTFRSFVMRINDIIKYRQATLDLERKYPIVSIEELGHSDDKVCIICREEMEATSDGPRKLACGHMFHLRCLRSWLERQQACPTCRQPLLSNPTTQYPGNYQAQPQPQAPQQNERPLTPTPTNSSNGESRPTTPAVFYISPDNVIPIESETEKFVVRSSLGTDQPVYLERVSPPPSYRHFLGETETELLALRGQSLSVLRNQIKTLSEVQDEIVSLIRRAQRIEAVFTESSDGAHGATTGDENEKMVNQTN